MDPGEKLLKGTGEIRKKSKHRKDKKEKNRFLPRRDGTRLRKVRKIRQDKKIRVGMEETKDK